MGVEQFALFMRHHIKSTGQLMSLADFKGQTLAIDASNFIYRNIIATMSVGKNKETGEKRVRVLTDNEGTKTGHIMNGIHFVEKMRGLGIQSVWVFDGKAYDLKQRTRDQRRTIKELAEESYEIAIKEGNVLDALKYRKRSTRWGGKEVEDMKKMLQMLGCITLDAEAESDELLALLSRHNQIDHVFSEDFDMLAYGVNSLIRRSRNRESGKGKLSSNQRIRRLRHQEDP